MNFFSYEWNGKAYDFRLSHKAQVEIEKKQLEMQYKAFENPEFIELAANYDELEKFQKAVKEKKLTEEELKEKQIELMKKLGPQLKNANEINEEIDPFDVGYILLHSLSRYNDLTIDDYWLLIEDMEEKLGFEKVNETFTEISDKVFTLIEAMNSKKIKTQQMKEKSQLMN